MAKHHLPAAQKPNGKQPTPTVVVHGRTNPPKTIAPAGWNRPKTR